MLYIQNLKISSYFFSFLLVSRLCLIKKLAITKAQLFLKKGSFIDQIYFSPFHPDGKIKKFKKKSNFRKPGNGMIINALKDWEIDKKKSFLIGDKQTDILAGKKSSIKSYLVKDNIFNQIKKLTQQS